MDFDVRPDEVYMWFIQLVRFIQIVTLTDLGLRVAGLQPFVSYPQLWMAKWKPPLLSFNIQLVHNRLNEKSVWRTFISRSAPTIAAGRLVYLISHSASLPPYRRQWNGLSPCKTTKSYQVIDKETVYTNTHHFFRWGILILQSAQSERLSYEAPQGPLLQNQHLHQMLQKWLERYL